METLQSVNPSVLYSGADPGGTRPPNNLSGGRMRIRPPNILQYFISIQLAQVLVDVLYHVSLRLMFTVR